MPRSIENIDVVWKFGPYSIKSAFEIEHSTSIYSGILRLSDLRAEAPNSNYPLFIVASDDRKRRVFEELKRPTFSGPCLRLNEVIRFLGYEKLREIDESAKVQPDLTPVACSLLGRVCHTFLTRAIFYPPLSDAGCHTLLSPILELEWPLVSVLQVIRPQCCLKSVRLPISRTQTLEGLCTLLDCTSYLRYQ